MPRRIWTVIGWTFTFSASLDPASEDRWVPFRVPTHEVGLRVLDILGNQQVSRGALHCQWNWPPSMALSWWARARWLRTDVNAGAASHGRSSRYSLVMKLRVAVVVIAAAVALSLTSPPRSMPCDGLRGMAPAARLALSIKDLGNGSTRVASAEGGWSLLVPSDWSVRPSIFGYAGFGQASISSYNPDGMKFSGNIGPGFLPISTGVRLDVDVWANPKKLDPAEYAASLHLFADQAGFEVEQMVPAGGQLAFRAVVKEDHLVGHDANGPIITRQSRLLWVVPVLGSDRLLVLDAWPRENPLIATADRIFSTLTLSTPVVARVPVKHSHDQVVHKWLYDASGGKIPGRRAEAKLMTDAELTGALPAISSSFGLDLVSRSLRIDEDPGKLLWVVVVSGGDLGRDWRQTPPQYTWIFFTAAATSETLPIDLTIYSTDSHWPSVFDDLTDLCR